MSVQSLRPVVITCHILFSFLGPGPPTEMRGDEWTGQNAAMRTCMNHFQHKYYEKKSICHIKKYSFIHVRWHSQPGSQAPGYPWAIFDGKKRVHSIIIYGRREWMYISCPCCLRIAVNVVVNMDTACSAINFIFHLFYIFDFLIFFHAINDFRPNRKHISWHLRGQSDKWSEKINVQLQKTNAVFYAKIQQESALYLWLSPKFKRFWSISIKKSNIPVIAQR